MKPSASIGRRLRWLSILSSGSAILAAGLALLYFELQQVRGDLLRRLESVAELIAFNSAAAVDFNDPEAARTILGSLKTRPEVVCAGIVVKRRVFAMYGGADGARNAAEGGGATGGGGTGGGAANRAALPEREDLVRTAPGYRFTDRELTVFRPISYEGRDLGTLFIRSSLQPIAQTWRRFAGVTGAVAIPALLIAILISQLPQRAFSRPILNLASLAAAVSKEKDYSVRAPVVRSAAEIEQLVSTFNQMLTDLQRQHLEIDEARATLEQRVAERTRELAAAYQELESFSYSVSHDLRAPLRAIDGFSEALLSRYDNRVLDRQGMHYVLRVRDGTKKMAMLIDDLLHLAQVTRSTLERRDVDVTALAEEVAADLRKRNPDRRVDCRIEHGLRASADPHLLVIVLENLLGNAWKYTGKVDHARIEVGQTSNGGQHFFVRDNGAGFDMTYADKLFGAFQRLHDESDFEGTGVGLATVKRIVGRHGGNVWADARPGEGATFSFTLGGMS